ncbi:MAG: response regulator transcription factor [Vicingaceae bacterium]
MKVLVVEDEIELNKLIYNLLMKEKFMVNTVFNYKDAFRQLIDYNFDVIILDIGLPDGNGLNLLNDIKINHPDSSIIIISAKNSLDDKLAGLDKGADDYLTKPFHLSELISRIRAIIRRKNFEGKNIFQFNELKIDIQSNAVYINNIELKLTKKEFQLLLYFISNKNRMITKDAVAEHLWGDNIDFVDNYDFIYTHIRNLRKKLTEAGCNDYIKTIYGLGYKFG